MNYFIIFICIIGMLICIVGTIFFIKVVHNAHLADMERWESLANYEGTITSGCPVIHE
jgi:hypothetical protein